MELKWEEGFIISVRANQHEVTISANSEGLRSLVNHLLALAQAKAGCHIHLDKYNSLEGKSPNLIIEKID